ncbi:MAG: DUF4129 domain-containing protein [Acidobacteriota bacterium]
MGIAQGDDGWLWKFAVPHCTSGFLACPWRQFHLMGWWLWLLLGTLSVQAEVSNALSLDEYRARLAQAREILENATQSPQMQTLAPDSTVESVVAYAERCLPAPDQETLYRLLPGRMLITTPTGRLTVDNQSFRTALDELCQATDAVEFHKRLQALKAHVTILERHVNDVPDGPTANVHEILAREAFQPIRKSKTPLEQLREWLTAWLGAWLEKIFSQLPWSQPPWDNKPGVATSGLWSNRWVQIGLWIGLTLLLTGAAVWLLVRRLRRPPTEAEAGVRIILGEPVAVDLDANDLLAQAQIAAGAGNWRQAVQKIYIALLHELDRREVIPLNPAWTNHEYLSAVRTQSHLYPAMHELTDCFDRLWYGQQPGSQEDYERCLSRYQEVRATLPTVV